MGFLKFPSLINHYRKKEIQWYLDKDPSLLEATYVITEKIHGANIQLIFLPSGKVEVASRNRVLNAEEDFYGIRNLLKDELATIVSKLKRIAVSESKVINLYGELFGSGIQKGVDYGNKQVRFFACASNGQMMPFKYLLWLLKEIGKLDFCVPVLGYVDGLAESLAVLEEFQTHLGKGDAEGIVITPAYSHIEGGYFSIKKKSENFKERARVPKVKAEEPIVDRFRALFLSYINHNRVQSVFSKVGEITSPKEFGKYIKLIIDDAKVDFLLDYGDEFASLDKGQQKKVFNVGGNIVVLLKQFL